MAPKPFIAITVSLDRGQRIRPGRDYLYVARAYAERVANGFPHVRHRRLWA